MKISIIDKQNLLSPEAVQKAEFRAGASFAKFGYNIRAIRITVEDINGPKGGADKECRVLVRLRKIKDITVTIRGESLSKSIPGAINRAARAAGRLIEQRVYRDTGRNSRFSLEA